MRGSRGIEDVSDEGGIRIGLGYRDTISDTLSDCLPAVHPNSAIRLEMKG